MSDPQTTRPFKELADAMAPESRARAVAKAAELSQTTDPKTTVARRAHRKWKSEFDAEMIRDWRGTSLREFARRFGVSGSGIVRNHAVRLGLMEAPQRSAGTHG